ncbi:hypothetical protein PZC41_14640, partial [Staphylococcus aureus]|uniref:hypothetical protein n=1 Tax=Staphylococcus aureus TaxID=1280 RepID=UPI0023B0283A
RRTFSSEFKLQMVRLYKNGERYFKASSADHRTKIEVIQKNAHQYSVPAMCKVLKIPRSTYYDSIKRKDNKITKDDSNVERAAINIFNSNRKVFSTSRIKNNLNDKGLSVSGRKIGRIMKKSSFCLYEI